MPEPPATGLSGTVLMPKIPTDQSVTPIQLGLQGINDSEYVQAKLLEKREKNRQAKRMARARMTEEQRQESRLKDTMLKRETRAKMTEEQKLEKRRKDAAAKRLMRASLTEEQKLEIRMRNSVAHKRSRGSSMEETSESVTEQDTAPIRNRRDTKTTRVVVTNEDDISAAQSLLRNKRAKRDPIASTEATMEATPV